MVPALQGSLFGGGEPAIAPDAAGRVERHWLDTERRSWVDVGIGWLHGADTLFEVLAEATPWTQGQRRMYDRVVDDPRLSKWYRSGASARELPHPLLADIRRALGRHYHHTMRGPGLNYYRDGNDSVAPHADRELRVLDDTLVAIVTLGGARPFVVHPKAGGRSLRLRPGSGDLLVMGGRCQLDFEHGVPKVRHAPPRISVSYRWAGRAAPDE